MSWSTCSGPKSAVFIIWRSSGRPWLPTSGSRSRDNAPTLAMRLLILAVGKLKAAPEQQLAHDYLQRAAKLGRKLGIASIELSEVPESKAPTTLLRQSDEARRLLAQLPSKAF